ncbi:sensor histidine kinase [Brevibacterium picturae]|uniref:histidine kinase n=1 Tax=Brevibacterium picturae TaxID=260553 RepID=A0ABN2B272_9MICO
MEDTQRPSWTSWAWPAAVGLVVLLVALLLLFPPTTGTSWTIAAFGSLVVAILSWAWWRTRRQRIRYEDRLESWARERAALGERLKIARELHDLASHGLGVMTVRASTAKLAGKEEWLAALDDIERVGRRSTDQLRRMLTVLRTSDSDVPMRPPESLADLEGIVSAARRRGLDIEAAIDETGLDGLSPELQMTVCAIVREALSNTTRHAGRTSARVFVGAKDDHVHVEVHDDGRSGGWRPHPGTGNGLRGLRERLGLHGGTLRAGNSGEGFSLVAEMPRESAS